MPHRPASDAEDGGYDDTDPSALSDFRSTLEPYGTWTDDPSYGTVWVPSPSVVGADFTPYVSAGHWAYDSDYAWVSDYDWGWAPFHYGRWAYAAGPGWEWIPGREYAGAWVSWRYGVDDWAYVGWAPLAPTWCWRGGMAVGLGFVPRAPYAFVGTGELFAPRVGARVVVGAQVGAIASHTRPYVPASASVGGRVAARPVVGGPSPQLAAPRARFGDARRRRTTAASRRRGRSRARRRRWLSAHGHPRASAREPRRRRFREAQRCLRIGRHSALVGIALRRTATWWRVLRERRRVGPDALVSLVQQWRSPVLRLGAGVGSPSAAPRRPIGRTRRHRV